MTDQVRHLARRWFEEVWNQGRREAIAELLAADAIIHDGGTDSVGPAGFYPFFDRTRAAFSDMQLTVHDMLAEGDRAVVRWSSSGKHTGDGLGLPASGKTFHITGITIIRVANGMLVEGWQNWDAQGMMDQLQGRERAATYIGA